MSLNFKPKNVRGLNEESYDATAMIYVDNVAKKQDVYQKYTIDKMKEIDEEWAKQGEP